MPIASADEFFNKKLPQRLLSNPALVEKINAVYKFVLEGSGGGTWIVDLTQPGGKVAAGDGNAGCCITLAATDFVDILNGQLNAQAAFINGKLRLTGDIGLAFKLQSILQ